MRGIVLKVELCHSEPRQHTAVSGNACYKSVLESFIDRSRRGDSRQLRCRFWEWQGVTAQSCEPFTDATVTPR